MDGRGISREEVSAESSHPGAAAFPGGEWTPAFVSDLSKRVLAAPPLVSEATYLAGVLDNKGVPRAPRPKDRLDVTYDAASHTLQAVNGALVGAVEGPPIGALDLVRVRDVTLPGVATLPSSSSPAATTAVARSLSTAFTRPVLPLPAPPVMTGSVAPLAPLPALPDARFTSPDSLLIARGASFPPSQAGTCYFE